MITAQGHVFEAPPVLQETEDEIQEPIGPGLLQGNQEAVGRQEALDASDRFAQVLRRVQDVGGENQVERVRVESLLLRVAFDVQELILHERIVPEAPLTERDERR
jgi:hypothetical protein